MTWIGELEASTFEIAKAQTLEQAKPWIELRARLCHAIPDSMTAGEWERLRGVRELGATALERLRAEADSLREQLSECHRSGQMMRALSSSETLEPQECDLEG